MRVLANKNNNETSGFYAKIQTTITLARSYSAIFSTHLQIVIKLHIRAICWIWDRLPAEFLFSIIPSLTFISRPSYLKTCPIEISPSSL